MYRIIFLCLFFAFSSGFSILNITSLTGSATSSFYYDSDNGLVYWGQNRTVTLFNIQNPLNPINVGYIRVGGQINAIRYYTSRRTIYMCCQDGIVYEYFVGGTWDGTAKASARLNTNSALQTCVIDMERELLLFANRDGGNKIYKASMASAYDFRYSKSDFLSNDVPFTDSAITSQHAYFLTNSKVFKITLGSSLLSLTTTIYNLGSGDQQAMVLDVTRNLLYIASEAGIGTMVSASTMQPLSYFYWKYAGVNEPLRSVAVDETSGATFWGTSAGRFVRVNRESFSSVYDSQTACSSWGCDSLQSTFVVPDKAIVYFATYSSGYLVTAQVHDCTFPTDCSSCVETDDTYCGWCLQTATCNRAVECNTSASTWISTRYNYTFSSKKCPSITKMSSNYAYYRGNENITITSDVAFQPSGTQCYFNTTAQTKTVNAVPLSSNTISCITPNITIGSGFIDIQYKGTTYISRTQSFAFYDCVGTCSSCMSSSKPRCGWCYATGTCSLQSQCQLTTTWNQNCSAIQQVTPSSSLDSGGGVVSIISNLFVNAAGYQCLFGSVYVTGTYISSTEIQCPIPASQTTGSVSLTIYLNSVVYAPSTSFYYYNCSKQTSCNSCIQSNQPACSWDLANNICQSDCTNCTLQVNTCPNITSFSPQSSQIAGGDLITITGSNFIPGSYTCVFFNSAPVVANRISSTTVTCTSPPFNANTSYVDLEVRFNNVIYASSVQFYYYDCTTGSSCATCLGSLRPACYWCPVENYCKNTPTCTVAQTSCPRLFNVTPSTHYYADLQDKMIITGSNFINSPRYTCRYNLEPTLVPGFLAYYFSNPMFINPPTVIVDQNSIDYDWSVAGPSVLNEQHDGISVVWDGLLYIPSNGHYTFYLTNDDGARLYLNNQLVVDDFVTGASRTHTVSTPLLNKGDYFPITLQYYNGNGDAVIRLEWSSPTFSRQVIPSFAFFFIPCKTCYGVSNATYINSTAVQCDSPLLDLSVSGGSTYANIQLFLNNVLYSQDTPRMYIYDCNGDFFGCSTCQVLNKPKCRWCHDKGLCAYQTTQCNSYRPCPVLYDFVPKTGSLDGTTLVTVTGSEFYPLNGTFLCAFGNNVVRATINNVNTLQCLSPSFYSVGDIPFEILHLDVTYFGGLRDFNYYDCSMFSGNCTQCLSYSECGICLGTSGSRCSSAVACNDGVSTLLDFCPSDILTVNPTEVLMQGETIHITRKNFPSTVTYQCVFTINGNTTIVDATRVSSTELTCTAPAVSFNKRAMQQSVNATFSILYNGFASSTPITLTYYDCTPYASTCAECSTSPVSSCGWCLPSGTCGSRYHCSNITRLWTQGNQCPIITSVTPNAGLVQGGAVVTIKGSRFYSELAFSCRFNGISSPGRVIDENTITCTVPTSESEGAVTLDVVVNGKAYVTTSQFQYVDCQSGKSINCGDCVDTHELCGWCRDSSSCGLEYQCDNWSKSCPVDTTGLAAGLTVGIFVFLVLVAIGIFFLRRRRQQQKTEIKKPNFADYFFDKAVTSPLYKPSRDVKNQLSRLEKLFANNLVLAAGLAQSVDSEQHDELARALVYLYERNTKSLPLILYMVTVETPKQDPNNLFHNSLAAKMFKFYAKWMGLELLWDRESSVIQQIQVMNEDEEEQQTNDTEVSLMDLEVNHQKLLNDDEADINRLLVELNASKVYHGITSTLEQYPEEFRVLSAHLWFEVLKQFNDDNLCSRAIGAFLFSRFVCPSITQPHLYGLLPVMPNMSAQRTLMLLSKLLFYIGTLNLPGKDEDFMKVFNPFIQSKMDHFKAFCHKLAIYNKATSSRLAEYYQNSIPKPSVTVTDAVAENSLIWLYNSICANKKKLETALADQKVDDVHAVLDAIKELDEIIATIGGPIQRNA